MQPGQPPVVGLTGGIASGKTTLSNWLAEQGAHIIDADAMGHMVIAPNGPAYEEVIAAFGPEIVAEDGTIDRKKLGAIVFSAPEKLQQLNAISHPLMADMMQREIVRVRVRPEEHRPPLIVLDAAILFEAGWNELCDQTWAVVTEPKIALARLMERNGLDEAAAQARLDAQMSNADRIQRADFALENNHQIDDLLDAAGELWEQLVEPIW